MIDLAIDERNSHAILKILEQELNNGASFIDNPHNKGMIECYVSELEEYRRAN